jgi:acyl-CoA synthetase (AMP-forming)/AMP-acid ligase II
VSVLGDTAREAARRFGSRRALVHGELALTYAQLDARSDEVAHGFARRGIGAGDVVALVLPSSIEFTVAYVALAKLGAVTTAVSPRFASLERRRVLERAEPRLVVATDELSEGTPPAVDVLLTRRAAAIDDLWSDLAITGSAKTSDQRTAPDAPETIVFTSGTTGTPKGALFTARQVRAITDMDTGGAWGAGGPQLVATGLPHVGFMTKLAGHLQQGATLHVLSRWHAADALRLIAHEHMPYIGGVAAQVSLLLRVPDFDSYDLSAVRGLIIGAGPSPAPLVIEARNRFRAPYSIRYSSTESGGLGTLTSFDAPDSEALYSVGRPRPGVELSIRDAETGAALDAGESGRVCLRSPAVMAGYWRDPHATATAFDPDGWLRTDDVGYVGEDGCLRLTGRLTEVYIRGGYNVYPLEIEAVLLDHPEVASVAVVPRADPVMGEIGVAVVIARDTANPPTLESLRAFAAPRLAAYKLPEAIRVVDELPLTPMDKVDRRALAARDPGGA